MNLDGETLVPEAPSVPERLRQVAQRLRDKAYESPMPAPSGPPQPGLAPMEWRQVWRDDAEQLKKAMACGKFVGTPKETLDWDGQMVKNLANGDHCEACGGHLDGHGLQARMNAESAVHAALTARYERRQKLAEAAAQK
jgi:hypothetical protein